MKVLVIGGGIGGQALAAALRRRGIDVSICERASAMRENGAALTLWPNAMRALGELGLATEARAAGWPILAADIRRPSGRTLSTTPVSSVSIDAGAGTIAIRRADLHRVLTSAAGIDRTQLGRRCEHVGQTETGAYATMADGETIRADVVIGADGLWSRVRELLVGFAPPRRLGCLWRGITPLRDATLLSGRSFETWGIGMRFGMVQINSEEVYWYAGASSWPEEGFNAARSRLLAAFGHWHAPIRAAIESTDAANAMRTVIYDRPPLDNWAFGRIALMGDAAHPMTPDLGQGACTALEDAFELAACLGEGGDPAAALRMYAERRLGRCTRIAAQSRRMGAISQWNSRALCAARNLVTRLTPASVVTRGLLGIVKPSGS